MLYRRFYGGDELDQVLLTIGLAFMSVAGATYIWGPLQQPLQPPQWLSGPVDLGFRSFPAYRSFLILCGAVLVTVLWLAVERTLFGARLRAAVDNSRMAQSVGIDTSRLFMVTFALGSGLAGLGGALGADLLAVNPGYALQNLIYFLIVVAVGGLGSIRGPFFAALLLGVADTASKYLVPEFGAFFIYALTLVVLLWRPQRPVWSGLMPDLGAIAILARRHSYHPFEAVPWLAALAAYFAFPVLSAAGRANPSDDPLRALGRSGPRLCRDRHVGPGRVFRHRRLHRRASCRPWLGRAHHRTVRSGGGGGADRVVVGPGDPAHDGADLVDADPGCRLDPL